MFVQYYNSSTTAGHPIADVFQGAPSTVETAFLLDTQVYLISGGVFYVATPSPATTTSITVNDQPFVEVANPFVGLPLVVDGAFQWPDFYVQFFSGDQYYQIPANSNKVGSLLCNYAMIFRQ